MRHGNYHEVTGRLTGLGHERVYSYARRLKQLTEGLKVLVLASTAPRAKDSSDVFCGVFPEATYEDFELLWEDDKHPSDHEAALKLIEERSEEADVLVIISHLPYKEVALQYAKNKLGAEFLNFETEPGEGFVINFDNKMLRRI